MQETTPRRALRVIAITSGKGGVGKTHVTVNLAIAFAQRGRKVLIVDGDVGLANVDILLDEAPRFTLADVMSGEKTLDEVLVHTSHGVSILPGTSGLIEMSEMSDTDRMRLLESLGDLDESFDTVLVDTAAGIGANARFFAGAAQEVLVVATPEPTSLADAYAMIKVLVRRCGMDRIALVVNQATHEIEAKEVFQRLSLLTSRFLSVVLALAGYIPTDPHVRESVMAQRPVLTAYPTAPSSVAFGRLADAILMRPMANEASGRMQLFWRRLIGGDGSSAAVTPGRETTATSP
jgi:flagellar biosynthesis protein FlhG